MPRTRLFWQIFPSYVIVVLLALAAATNYAFSKLREWELQQTHQNLEARARLLEGYLHLPLSAKDESALHELCGKLGTESATRITVIMPDGRVVADSDHDPAKMDNHAARDEVRAALAGAVGHAMRHSDTLGQDMVYVAVPFKHDGRTIAVIRTSLPLTRIQKILQSISGEFAMGMGLIAALAALVSLWVSRQLARPMEALRQGVLAYQKGEMPHKLPIPNTAELGALAETINLMATDLHERIQTISAQRAEQDAILSSMVEGVLAVDSEERIIHLNRAAEEFFNLSAKTARGCYVQSVIRNPDLIAFLQEVLAHETPRESDIVRHGPEDRFFQARGTVLRNAAGKAAGTVIVLHEVTRLRQLERMRRDFVANVSHELRTPVTAIQGFAETLLADLNADPDQRKEFLEIILRQAKRLAAIIEDLLCLARVEEMAEKSKVQIMPGRLRPVIEAAIQGCQPQAERKHIAIHLACPEDLQAVIHSELLERAVLNLIDNAVKFSNEGAEIHVNACQDADHILIRVRDQGCGIPAEHLPRIFERFYRVDKSRSRKQGGTGLGLSIVKHVAAVHNGRVSVESTPGKGSIFIIELPALPDMTKDK